MADDGEIGSERAKVVWGGFFSALAIHHASGRLVFYCVHFSSTLRILPARDCHCMCIAIPLFMYIICLSFSPSKPRAYLSVFLPSSPPPSPNLHSLRHARPLPRVGAHLHGGGAHAFGRGGADVAQPQRRPHRDRGGHAGRKHVCAVCAVAVALVGGKKCV